MDEQPELELDRCKLEAKTTQEFREAIPDIVQQLVGSCRREDCFDHVGPEPIPSREQVIDIIHRAFRLLYPGYFIRKRLDQVSLGYYFGQEAVAFFEVLSQQIALAIRHECLRHDLPCTHCEERGQEDAIRFMQELPKLRSALAKDVRAGFEGDPAAKSYDEIIFSYPGLLAVTVYRLAHQLVHQYVPLMPRIM